MRKFVETSLRFFNENIGRCIYFSKFHLVSVSLHFLKTDCFFLNIIAHCNQNYYTFFIRNLTKGLVVNVSYLV